MVLCGVGGGLEERRVVAMFGITESLSHAVTVQARVDFDFFLCPSP